MVTIRAAQAAEAWAYAFVLLALLAEEGEIG